jgi:hypothetical protein
MPKASGLDLRQLDPAVIYIASMESRSLLDIANNDGAPPPIVNMFLDFAVGIGLDMP